eukprot:290203_1
MSGPYGTFLTDTPRGNVTADMLQADRQSEVDDPTINKIYRNPRSGERVKLERYDWGFGGFVRHQIPDCPKKILDSTNFCVPIKGGGSSRRCPNTNRGCQMFFNYQKFLQCYNRFEFKGKDVAMDKCGFFLQGVHPKVMEWFEELRSDNDW